jgi:hypothetical protein
MKLNPPTLLAAIVLIGAGGFIAGRATSREAGGKPAESPAATRATRSSSAGSEVGPASMSARPLRTPRPATAATPQERNSKLETIVRNENPLDRQRALLAFINQLAPGDFLSAVDSFRSLGITDSRIGEYSLLLTAWAQADPNAALEYAKANTRNAFAQDTILTSWGSTDPEAAIRWAQANHDGDGANPYLPGIIRGLVESDPARATELMAAMPRSEERGKALDFMLPHLLKNGNDATRDWIAAITDDSLRNGAILRAAEPLARIDPAGTAAWLLENPGEASDRRMDDVYNVWARKNPEEALASLSALPAGGVRSNALRGVITRVAVEDPKAAVSLMDQYSNDVNDRVVQNFIWHSFGTDPATAAGQIARISDENQRNRMYRRTLEAWNERDPTSAQSWMQTNPLPESVRSRFTQ